MLGVGVRRRVGAIALPRTGYFGWSAAGERLVVDAGEPSPPYQPGHAHCGLLGFELDLAGRRVVVDAGVSGYEGDPLRGYVRSTRAHSTVSIGGGVQSELWGTFRMGRRARVVEAAGEEDSVGYRFSGAYQPFYSPSVLHQRRIERDSAGWLVTDRVEGRPGAPVTSYLHLHPDFRVRADGERWIASDGPLEVLIEPRGVDQVRLRVGERDPDQGWYCPRFGVALPAPVLEMEVYRNDGRPFGYRLRPLNFS